MSNKVPCGGFRIGDGLTMDGDTLKSLGGAEDVTYVKLTSVSSSLTYASDSPIKSYDELLEAQNDTKAIYLIWGNNIYTTLNISYGGQGIDFLCFERFYSNSVSTSTLSNEFTCDAIVITSNSIEQITQQYTLTPAT